MLAVKTKLGESKIHGIGVFADEFIPKGAIVHIYLETFDIVYSDAQFENLPDKAQEYVIVYGYYNEEEGGYVLCGDNGRFVNHSLYPNMQMIDKVNTVATRDIQIGEEITEDYYCFDEKVNLKPGYGVAF